MFCSPIHRYCVKVRGGRRRGQCQGHVPPGPIPPRSDQEGVWPLAEGRVPSHSVHRLDVLRLDHQRGEQHQRRLVFRQRPSHVLLGRPVLAVALGDRLRARGRRRGKWTFIIRYSTCDFDLTRLVPRNLTCCRLCIEFEVLMLSNVFTSGIRLEFIEEYPQRIGEPYMSLREGCQRYIKSAQTWFHISRYRGHSAPTRVSK